MTSVEEIVHHYQKSIEKASNDEKRLLHCLNKLCKLPVTVQHLQETGIGRTVNSLRKFDGDVGAKAKTLVTKWKEMVAAEESSENEAEESEKSDDDNNNSDRDDVDVASPPESSPENRKSQINEIKIKKEIVESHLSSDTHNHQFNEEKPSRRKDMESKEHMSTYSENQIDSDLNDNGYKLKHRHHSSSKSSSHSKSHTPSNNTKSSNGHQSSSSSHSKDKLRDSEKHSHSSHKHEKSTSHGGSSSSSSKRNREDSLSDKLSDIEENKLLIDDEKSKSSKKSKSEHKSSSNHHHSSSSSSKHREHSKSKEHGSGSSHHKSKHEKSRKDNDDEHFKEKTNSVLHQNGENIITKHSREASPQQNDAKQSRSEKSGKEKRTKSADAESKNNDSNKTAKKRVHESDDEKDGDGIDQSTGASFAEALGMLEPVSSKKTPKKKTQSPTQTKFDKFQSSASSSSVSTSTNSSKSIKSNSSKPSSSKSLTPLLSTPSSSSSSTPSLLAPTIKLRPLDAELSLDFVPTISNNYKPMPLNPIVMDCVFYNNKPQKKFMTDEEAFGASISSKTMRTKVYSGTKTCITVVPPLLELCIRVLQKNIDALEYTGGVPFDILKPVLDRASADQLFNFEHFNPYLIDDSDVLWQGHCNRRFKGKKRLEMESWRDMFIRCFEEQESKLASLTENIKKTQVQSVPVKQTKLAYIDSTAKAPRNIRNKQIQFGTERKLITTPAARVASLSNVTSNIAQVGDVRLKVVAGSRDSAQVQGTSSKPRKAPLMAKAMQLMKGRFKR